MTVLRTPDARFEKLPGYAFAPHYLDLPPTANGSALRLHYVDAGPPTAAPVLMLHGEPSWSYLYRSMITPLAATGHRVMAPDLIGFGRSDKPAERAAYSYQNHVDWIGAWLKSLDLINITLFCQDWGGLIGLRLLAQMPERFARVVAANTFLPTGDHDLGEGFLAWRKFSQEVSEFPVGKIIAKGCARPVSAEVQAAYDAPFPDESYKAGARAFPMLVPTTPDDPASAPNRAAWGVLRTLNIPFLTAFSDRDPITRGGDTVLHKLIPGCAGQPHQTMTNAGHFLQEDCGTELAEVIAGFITR